MKPEITSRLKDLKWFNGLIALSVLLIISFQGLYFIDQQLIGLIVLSIIGIMLLWRRQRLSLAPDLISGFLLANLLITLLVWPFVVEKGMHIFGLFQWSAYFIFWGLLRQVTLPGIRRIQGTFVWTMALVGVVSSVAFATGCLSQWHLIIDGRLSGSFQYANTFGIVLVVALLLSFKMKMAWSLRLVLSLSLVVPLVLTMSRAVYIIGFMILVVAWLMTKAEKDSYWTTPLAIGVGFVYLLVFDQNATSSRLTESLAASEWQTRLLYYQDAIEMIKAHPMGLGYNGYHYVQSLWQTGSTYHVKYVHSSLLQGFLDLGILGGLLLTALMFYLVFLRKYPMINRLSVLTILGHSLVDIDLSFPISWFLILALIWQPPDKVRKEASKVSRRTKVMIRAGLLVVIISSSWLLTSVRHYNKGDYTSAIDVYEGYTEAYRQMFRQKATYDWMVPYAETLYERNPYVTELYPLLIDQAIEAEAFDLALYYCEEQIRYSPILIRHYETYSQTLNLAATWYLAYGDLDKAEDSVQRMLEIPTDLEELAKDKETNYNVNHKPDLEMNEALMKAYIEAGYIMEKIENGRKKTGGHD